jgi:hypothetical protein
VVEKAQKIMFVNQHTRAGVNGRDISCPHCLHGSHVFHFDWDGLVCSSCKSPVDKNDWIDETGMHNRQRVLDRKDKIPAYVPGNMGHQERTESQRQKEMKNAEAMWGESGAAFEDAKVHDAKDILWKT